MREGVGVVAFGHTGHASEAAQLELYKAALDNESVGVAILSVPDFRFEYVNPAFQAFAPGKEMVGKLNAEVFPEMAFLGPPVLEKLATGRSWRQEDTPNLIRRAHGAPLERVYGTFEVSRLDIGGEFHLLVTGEETTRRVLLSAENARLHQEEVQRLALSETLAGINRVMHSSLDYDEIMQRALEEATKVLGARAGAVFVGLDGESEARYVYGFPKAFLGRRFSSELFPFSQVMEETKEPVAVDAARMSQLMNAALARVFRVRSLLAIPIVTRGRLVGGIGIIYGSPHDFTRPEIDFARTFGTSLSLALENADLYRRQERVADTLQEALLALPERLEGIEFAHMYHSAAEAAKVGGDFYDLFELEHQLVGVTVGDISGKGLEAAVLTSLVKNAVRAEAQEKADSPATVMRVVNKVLFSGSRPESFATVFFGVLDCTTGVLTYCNAGHTTSLLLRAGGAVETLPSNSALVGAFRDAEYADASVMLAPGDVLLMYTDGVIEARSAEGLYGEERLLELVRRTPEREPGRVVEYVSSDVVAFADGKLTDDLAILALRRA